MIWAPRRSGCRRSRVPVGNAARLTPVSFDTSHAIESRSNRLPVCRGSLHGARSRAGETPPKHWEPKGYSFSRRISRAYRHDTITKKSVGRSPLACLRWSGVPRRRGGLWGWGFKCSRGQVRA